MLILTRQPGQRIVIGSGIVVEVLKISGHGVAIGIHAPREIPVHRREVFERIQLETAALEAAASEEAAPEPHPEGVP